MPPKARPEYTFDERGFPTLRKGWDGKVPGVPIFASTDSGRRARGELEAICDMLVKKWMTDMPNHACTAEWLAQEATQYDQKPTTSAATARVLERWVEIGYAVTARRPIRFVRLTEDGVNLGLAELYRKQKRNKRRRIEAARRGERN